MVCLYSGKQNNRAMKKECIPTYSNMNEYHRHNIEQRKPYYVLNDIIYGKFYGVKNQLVMTFTERGLAERDSDENVLNSPNYTFKICALNCVYNCTSIQSKKEKGKSTSVLQHFLQM